jgi:hypothetical protein
MLEFSSAIVAIIGMTAAVSGITAAASHTALATKGEAGLHISSQGIAHQSPQGASNSGVGLFVCLIII